MDNLREILTSFRNGPRGTRGARMARDHMARIGLIRDSNDRAGVAQVMRVGPGFNPSNPSYVGDEELGTWLEEVSMGHWGDPPASGRQSPLVDPGDDVPGEFYNLGAISTIAVATTTGSFSLSSLDNEYDNARLFVGNCQGELVGVNTLKVDGDTPNLGEGSAPNQPAAVLDIDRILSAGFDPRVYGGLWLGRVRNSLSFSVEVLGNTAITPEIYLFATREVDRGTPGVRIGPLRRARIGRR